MTEAEIRVLARRYEVRIVPNRFGGYSVVVPAFGDETVFATGGATPEEALLNAYEAIECEIEGRLAERAALPEPVREAA